jgi:hypothetical protein
MNGIHPKVNAAAIGALCVAMLATGCQSTSSGVNNAFLAPDRVAPPSTRALAPGQAQPYYQGDPLPVMQSATTSAPNPLLAGDTAAARTATGKTLAWNSAASTPQPASVAAQSAAVSPWPPVTQSPAPIASTPENAVSIPADIASLRFQMQPPVQPSPTSQVAIGSTPQAPSPLTSAAAPNQGVMLASYNTPVSNASTVPSATPSNAASPWRTPQYSGVTSSPSYPQQASAAPPISPQSNMSMAPAYPMAQAPITLPSNPMAVDLRAVPSPAQPGDPMPRVRVPGYDTPEMASADGFRPRASMR